MQKHHAPALLLAGCGLLGGCHQSDSVAGLSVSQFVGGTTQQVRDVQAAGGFLPSPSLLQSGGAGQLDLVYLNPAVNFASYNSLILDPVAVWTGPNSAVSKVPEAERQALANTFTSDLATALKAHCRMATSNGPGTARLRFALVDAKEPNAALNTVATFVPYISTAYGLASYATNKNVGYFAGTATIEGYATDTSNGALLWQAVDKRGGSVAAVENTLDTRLDIHHAFQAWSGQLISRLKQMGVCTT
jgi:hypothetical protein